MLRRGRSCHHRRDSALVGLAGADPYGALQRDDEDLPVADLPGAAALAERLDRRVDEVVGDGDLKAHLLRQGHLHGRAAVRLDALELAAVPLHPADRNAPDLGAVEGFQGVVRPLGPDDADDELQEVVSLDFVGPARRGRAGVLTMHSKSGGVFGPVEKIWRSRFSLGRNSLSAWGYLGTRHPVSSRSGRRSGASSAVVAAVAR